MMPSTQKHFGRIHTCDYVLNSSQKVFFDTCIWLSIFGPVQSKTTLTQSDKDYSDLYNAIVSGHKMVFSHFLVLQEFFNRYLEGKRKAYNSLNPILPIKSLSDFRKDAPGEFQSAINDVNSRLEAILTSCTIEKIVSPSVDEIKNMANQCGPGKPLLNDLEIIRICQIGGYLLVTQDSDFKSAPVTVISSNSEISNKKTSRR